MKKSFGNRLVELYKENRKLELLQYAYIGLLLASVVVCGLIALFNQALGVGCLIIPLICLVAFAMNMVAWSLIKTTIEHFYPEVLKKAEKDEKKKSSKK